MSNDIPRRIRMDLYSPGERAIRDAREAVEMMGAHPLLTDAVVLLGQAQDKVADFVDETYDLIAEVRRLRILTRDPYSGPLTSDALDTKPTSEEP